MRKILSVVLAVVMLASLAAVVPVSAAASDLGPVITEIVVDTTGGAKSMSGSDLYEFIEIYNPTDKPINLYDYSITLNSSLAAGQAPDDASFTDFTPILSPAMSKAAGNTLGTVATSKQAQSNSTPEDSVWPFYPTNPDTAVLQPGEVAVVWLYTFDSYRYSYAYQSNKLTFNDFREYWNLPNDVLLVAIDANGDNGSAKMKNEYGSDSANIQSKGSNNDSNDLMADVYPSSAGRFNGANSGSRYYGIVKTADIADARTTLKHSQIESYVYVNYDSSDPMTNLMYLYSGGQTSGSFADVSYNFTYTNEASAFGIGKVAGKLKFGDWLTCQYATPGKLLPKQAADFKVLGSEPKSKFIGKDKSASITVLEKNYLIYSEDFESVTGTDATLRDNLGWNSTTNLNKSASGEGNRFKVNISISNGKLICSNTTKYDNLITILKKADADAIVAQDKDATVDSNHPDYNKKLAYADLLIEYDIKYLDLGTADMKADRYASVVYGSDDNITYGVFILRINGTGNNQYRNRSVYLTFDVAGEFYAANNDTAAGRTSIINKITNGRVFASNGAATNPESMRLVNLDETLHVKIYVDQTYGPFLFVNDYLVSVPVNTAFWGMHRERGDVGIGLFVSQYVKCEIDNIKVWALGTDNNAYDVYKNLASSKTPDGNSYGTPYVDSLQQKANLYEMQNPSTGDATVYVAIAMTVSFISLAALVIIKRKKTVTE